MYNAGKASSDDKVKHDMEDDASVGRSPILLLTLSAVTLVCLIIGVQAFGILYSIIFPPAPPLPDDVTETRHTSIDHGIDEWVYETEQHACDVVQYYETQNGQCAVTANVCSEGGADNLSFSNVGQHVATCVGEVEFNIFAYRWEANIANGYRDRLTQFSLIREVFWTGAVPPRLDPRKGFDFDG